MLRFVALVAMVCSPSVALADDLWPLPPDAVARLGSTRLRQGQSIQSLAFSPDGSTLVAADHCGRICLWDAKTGELRRHFEVARGRWSWNGSLHYGASGNVLITLNDHSFGHYDTRTGRRLASAVEEGLNVDFTAVSHDGKTAVVGTPTARRRRNRYRPQTKSGGI